MLQKKNRALKLHIGLLIFVALISSIIVFAPKTKSTEITNNFKKCWHELTPDPQYSFSQSFRFYRLKTENGSSATLVAFDLNDHNFVIKPFFNPKATTVSKVVKENKALVGINGGYFNLSDGESTSYVIIDKINQCDPKTNKALINNPELAPYLETIFNRSEFRILIDKNNKLKACITAHNDPVPEGWSLIHSLQAGPRLLPDLTATEEAFVRKSLKGTLFDSIGSDKNAARTAIGITRDNHILLLTVANKKQDEFSSGITLEELTTMLRALGCNQALNCDGGTSTTMVIAQGDTRDELNYVTRKVISSEPEKLVKSGIMIVRNKNRNQSRYSGQSVNY